MVGSYGSTVSLGGRPGEQGFPGATAHAHVGLCKCPSSGTVTETILSSAATGQSRPFSEALAMRESLGPPRSVGLLFQSSDLPSDCMPLLVIRNIWERKGELIKLSTLAFFKS